MKNKRFTHKDANGKWYVESYNYGITYSRGGAPAILGGDFIDKLAMFENATENKTLVRLPCKIGDLVYAINKGRIWTDRVVGFSIYDYGVVIHTINIEYKTHQDHMMDDIDQCLFLTKEMAERRIKSEG